MTAPTAPASAPAAPVRVTYDYVTRTIANTLGNPSRGSYVLLGVNDARDDQPATLTPQ